ncbi:L-aminoadipate-semialdehyde dehydrogenase [Mycena indigotica]|uniref:L-aminoadipate-semialdehyde dehydrogenase n=1 Tax=Mycena indigotica TaxID=2126181 RepID=A0A8H6VYT0_9AGAR|nr:L-aminoadipate-semialdehyde dehydrogenase [Mycena indigotica]KAF7296806.1 L-aminoadipate-semialdehyde dehydrogenase [Mycena indigotica]
MPTSLSTPPELWLEVFKALPTAALASVTETSRAFAALARPLLFAHFEFVPYGCSMGRRDGGWDIIYHLLGGEELQRAASILDTWTSNSIAPLVRSCTIRASRSRDSLVAEDNEEAAMRLSGLHTFFSRLSRFTKLKHVLLDDVTLPTDALSNIYHLLPSLEVLYIVCRFSRQPVAFENTRALAKLRKLVLKIESQHTVTTSATLAAYRPFFGSAMLKELDLSCNLRAWSEDPHDIPTFPTVTHVRIYPNLTVQPVFASLLPKFPVLQDLTIVGISSAHPAIPDIVSGCRSLVSTVAHLSTGSSALVELFLYGDKSALRTLHFPAGDNISTLCKLIQTAHPLLVCLSLDVPTAKASLLAPMWACLPALRSLKINFQRVFRGEDAPDASEESKLAPSYLQSLCAPHSLAPTLQTLVLKWHFLFCSPAWPQQLAHTDFDLPAVAAAVAAATPTLTAIGVDAASFALRWQCRAAATGLLRGEPWVDEAAFAAENIASYERIQRAVEQMWVDEGLRL